MKATYFYALVLAAANIVFNLVSFLLGFQTDRIAEGTWFNLLFYAIGIVVTLLGIRAVRDEGKDKSMSYGKGVGSGVLINLYGGLISSIYSFFHLTFINPNFGDYMMDLMQKKWADAGMGDAQIDAASKFMRFFFSPAMASVTGLIYTVLFGLVVALVASAFLKRAPKPVNDAPLAA
jgi:hypothetical protein